MGFGVITVCHSRRTNDIPTNRRDRIDCTCCPAYNYNHQGCLYLKAVPIQNKEGTMTFTKRIGKWGLLCKPNTDKGKWHLVTQAKFIFDTREEALEQSLDWVSSNKSCYLYKPVLVEVSYTYPDED